jgi:hypothetical protein
MPEDPAPTHMDPAVRATYEAASEQAEATRYAADIAADATWDATQYAADIAAKTAWETALYVGAPVALLTALAALVAGGLAYKGAIKAAQHQAELERSKDEARVGAYAISQITLINFIINRIPEWKTYSEEAINIALRENVTGSHFGVVQILIREMNTPQEWQVSKWEEHALLRSNYVRLLTSARSKMDDIFQQWKHLISIINQNEVVGPTTSDTIIDISRNNIKALDDLKTSLENLKLSIPEQHRAGDH